MKRKILNLLIIFIQIQLAFGQNSDIQDDDKIIKREEFNKSRYGKITKKDFEDINKKKQKFNFESLSPLPNNQQKKDVLLEWERLGPSNIGGRTRSIEINRLSNDVIESWAAAISGGLWYNPNILNNTSEWQKIFDDNSVISTIALHGNKKRICLGTGEQYYRFIDKFRGNGIFEKDENNTWSLITPKDDNRFHFVNKLIYIENDIWATTSLGLFRFNGQKWDSIKEFENIDVFDIEVAQNNIYVSVFGGIWKSSDLGKSWNIISTDINGLNNLPLDRIELAISNTFPDILYAAVQSADNKIQIYKTKNGGTNWIESGKINDTAYNTYCLSLSINPSNPNIVFVGCMNLYRTMDGGESWKKISHWFDNNNENLPYVHADNHNIIFDDRNPQISIIGNDGGVTISTDILSTKPNFKVLNNGYNVSQLYSVAYHPLKDNFIFGTQDNGNYRLNKLSYSDADVLVSGDGGLCFIDAFNPQIQIISYIGGKFYLTKNEFSNIDEIDFNSESFITPSEYNAKNKKLYVYQFGNKIIEYDVQSNFCKNNTSDCRKITVLINTDEEIKCLKISPNIAQEMLYIGTSNGNLYRIRNPTISPTITENLTKNKLPNGQISSIEIEEGNENHIVVTFSEYQVKGKIWETNNALSSNPTWRNIDGNFSDLNIPVLSILLIPNNNIKAIIGTINGVYTTDNLNTAAPNWISQPLGLGNNTIVEMLKFRKSDNLLLAATHGQGLYYCKLENKPISNFNSLSINNYLAAFEDNNKNTKIYYSFEDQYLDIETKKNKATKIQIINSKDDNIFKETTIKNNTKKIDLNDLPEGEYDIKIIKYNKVTRENKIIIQKNN